MEHKSHLTKYSYIIINIQTGKPIPQDEPVFVLRAQDKLAGMTLEGYADCLEEYGASEEAVKHVREHAAEMEAWPVKKMPD